MTREELIGVVEGGRLAGASFDAISKQLREEGVDKSAASLQGLMRRRKPEREPTTTAPHGIEERGGPGDYSRVLVLSDMHTPFQHPDTVAFLTAVQAKYSPTHVVCIGDEVDYHNMSFHDSDPDLPGAGDELQLAIKQLRPLYKLFPRMDLIDSNHGSMVYRKGKHHGIPRKFLRDYGEILEAPAGWTWHMDLLLKIGNNQVYFHHGLASDVMKAVAQRGVCVVQGHYHTKFCIGYLGTPAALLWGMNVGCSIDSKAFAFAYDRTNLQRPLIGHGIILDGQPKLLPMILGVGGRWNGVVP